MREGYTSIYLLIIYNFYGSDGRYLLLMTEKDALLDILQQQLPDGENAIVIYGSSFPRDQEYTQVAK